MKCSTIQRDNFNREHAATIIATNVQKSILFHEHKPGDAVSIRQSPHWQLSDKCQTRPHSDTAGVGLSKNVYSFVANFFTDLLAPNLQTHTGF